MKGSLCLINPYDQEHLKLITEYELTNGINNKISEFIKDIKKLSKEEYEKQKYANDYELILVIIDQGKIKDSCHIQVEKDIKSCYITLVPTKSRDYHRNIITRATDYAMNILGMQEVFIKLPTADKNLLLNLENQGFENLGTENGEYIFLKDQETILESKYHL